MSWSGSNIETYLDEPLESLAKGIVVLGQLGQIFRLVVTLVLCNFLLQFRLHSWLRHGASMSSEWFRFAGCALALSFSRKPYRSIDVQVEEEIRRRYLCAVLALRFVFLGHVREFLKCTKLQAFRSCAAILEGILHHSDLQGILTTESHNGRKWHTSTKTVKNQIYQRFLGGWAWRMNR